VLSHEHVAQLLQELEDEGLAARNVDPSRETTYYLTADLYRPNPPTVTWYAPDEDID
jgi:DNA-binding HxlR family transcriptional regulator